jgi:hypothetical protein
MDYGRDGWDILYKLPGNEIRETVTAMKLLVSD